MAYLLVRSIFFVLYSVAVVIALLLIKQNWPHLDIYKLLEWLQSALPVAPICASRSTTAIPRRRCGDRCAMVATWC